MKNYCCYRDVKKRYNQSSKTEFASCISIACTVTFRLFTHIVSTEKVRKDTRDTKYTYYNIMAVF